MKQLWKNYRVPAGFTLLCLLLAANVLLSERIRLPFTETAYRRNDEPVVFWASVAMLFGMALAFPLSLLRSATKRGKRAVPFGDQVNDLKECGIALPDNVVERLQESGSLEEYERDPYIAILAAVADDDEVVPPANFFYLDTESIHTTGDYVSVAAQMVAISEGTLTATGLNDEIDAREKTATLDGTINGTPFRWRMPLEDDYIHETFFAGFRTVLEHTGSGKIFAGLDLGGQDLLVFCVDEDQIKRFRTNLGLTFHAL